ncbi:hypothetical protein PI124_g20945 [Phytophthora idaei]|nr:hypothetical protein PI125_g22623 [Phytophthora idaei]KAG3233995.1 hypothetical protein PI124_g20945 [Phytophthora idaei]
MQMLARIATHHACNIVEEQYTACQKSNYNVIASGLTSAFQPPKATKHSKTTRSTWIRTRAVVSSTRPNFCRVVI